MGALAFLPPSKRHAKRHVTQRQHRFTGIGDRGAVQHEARQSPLPGAGPAAHCRHRHCFGRGNLFVRTSEPPVAG